MKTLTSEQILRAEDLYNLQDSFCCSHIPFKYVLTEEEKNWAEFNRGKYSINDFVLDNTENNILTFDCPFSLSETLSENGSNLAPMLSNDTALQKLFFWLGDVE